ncbi:MAG: hypothetical protein DRI54_01260 [Bacteroidetes bacterium]|nr:MAG: hypothetical protein DRI54_01260 [Bacteroidota bacterium]
MAFQTEPKMKDTDTNAILKASYIYNFAKMIDWPEAEKSGNFIIGVYGNSNVYKELIKKYASKNIGNQQIEVKKLSDTPSVGKIHLLYITKEKKGDIPVILKSIKKKPVLVVTENSGSLDEGSIINFIIVDANLNFELNVEQADKHDLIVGSRLKDLAYKK